MEEKRCHGYMMKKEEVEEGWLVGALKMAKRRRKVSGMKKEYDYLWLLNNNLANVLRSTSTARTKLLWHANLVNLSVFCS